MYEYKQISDSFEGKTELRVSTQSQLNQMKKQNSKMEAESANIKLFDVESFKSSKEPNSAAIDKENVAQKSLQILHQ